MLTINALLNEEPQTKPQWEYVLSFGAGVNIYPTPETIPQNDDQHLTNNIRLKALITPDTTITGAQAP